MTTHQSKQDYLKYLAIVFVTLTVAALFVTMIQSFLVALFLAAVFSALAHPFYRYINSAVGERPGWAAALTLLFISLALLIPGIALLIMVAQQAQDIAQHAIPWIEREFLTSPNAEIEIPDWVPLREQIRDWLPNITAKLGEILSQVGASVAQAVSAITSSAAGFFLNLFVLLYAMFYFLTNGPDLLKDLKVSATALAGVQDRVFQRAVVVTRATLKGTLIIGIVQGLLGGIGFAVFGVGAAAFWGAVMAIASMLPVVGTSLIWVPAVVYLFATGDTTAAIGLALWSAVVVSNIDNVLRPVLVGGDTAMPDLVILISTFGGLSMFGAAGLILGPVVAAVFFTMLDIASNTFSHDSIETHSPQAPSETDAAQETLIDAEGQTMNPSGSLPPAETEHQGLFDVSLTSAQRKELAEIASELQKTKVRSKLA
ncbi:MAG: AI-2E family transporter [Hyphomicrobiaceae bacterium]